MNKQLKITLESALMIALSTALSFAIIYKAPLGGSVTIASMLPIAVLSYRRGVLVGFSAGLVYSIIQFIFDLSYLSYAKTPLAAASIILFDYVIAFSVIGFAGMLRGLNKDLENRKKAEFTFIPGLVIVIVLRFFCHFISGAVVWYELTKEWYADDPSNIVFKVGPWMYSFIYNIQYMGPELLITLFAGGFLVAVLNFRKENLIYSR